MPDLVARGVSLGLRGKLFLLSLTLILGGAVVAGVFLERGLTRDLHDRSTAELTGAARGAAAALQDSTGRPTEVADRMGDALGVRVTFIDAAGAVVADSEVEPAALGTLENHGDRPEVQQARATGFGEASRLSATLGLSMHYVAVAGPTSAPVVRVARSEALTAAAVRQLRLSLLTAGLVLLVVAVLLSAFASGTAHRMLSELLEYSRAIAAGEHAERLSVDRGDELGRLAEAFNRVADDLDASRAHARAERERLESVLEGMSEAVVALDAEDRITTANRAASELLVLEGDPTGQRLNDVLQTEMEVVETIDDETGRTVEYALPGDPPRRLLARQRPRGDGLGSVVVMLDVSRVRRLEKVRSDFVANVSHELRTPVAVLQANAETLLDGALEEPEIARRFVEAIHRQAGRLSALVNDLLDIARIEAGRYELEPEPLALLAATNQVVEILAEDASKKGQTVDVDVDADIVALSDPKAYDQIVRNFLENAVKYTPQGGRITVRATRTGARVRLEVADDGPGVPAKYQSRLFERFYRVDKGRSREMGGTGLGLSIAKHLAESQQGEVGYEAAEPQGSIFWFELPAAPFDESVGVAG